MKKLKEFRWEVIGRSSTLYIGNINLAGIHFGKSTFGHSMIHTAETTLGGQSIFPSRKGKEAKAWVEETVRAEIASLFEEEV